jgi:NAD(P)-dependent dehydrogenase (short-subunit alcohol dehydrogenase family)
VFEVNFMGAVTTSQAFIPLLRAGQQKGRVINISSVVSAVTGYITAFTCCCVLGSRRGTSYNIGSVVSNSVITVS